VSSPLAAMKARIEKLLPSGRLRQFRFDRFSRLAAAGDVVEIEG
jgi:hypothetical protein